MEKKLQKVETYVSRRQSTSSPVDISVVKTRPAAAAAATMTGKQRESRDELTGRSLILPVSQNATYIQNSCFANTGAITLPSPWSGHVKRTAVDRSVALCTVCNDHVSFYDWTLADGSPQSPVIQHGGLLQQETITSDMCDAEVYQQQVSQSSAVTTTHNRLTCALGHLATKTPTTGLVVTSHLEQHTHNTFTVSKLNNTFTIPKQHVHKK